jgi:hypothetical protein
MIHSGPVPVSGSFQVSFSCSKKQGAVLSLPFDARREDTFRKGDFRSYIVAHCERWLSFAQGNGLDVERMEELILVTGCDRTQPWALAAFTSTAMSASIAFDVSVLSGAVTAPSLKWKVVQQAGQSIPYNYGPRPEVRHCNVIWPLMPLTLCGSKNHAQISVSSSAGTEPGNAPFTGGPQKSLPLLNLNPTTTNRTTAEARKCVLKPNICQIHPLYANDLHTATLIDAA